MQGKVSRAHLDSRLDIEYYEQPCAWYELIQFSSAQLIPIRISAYAQKAWEKWYRCGDESLTWLLGVYLSSNFHQHNIAEYIPIPCLYLSASLSHIYMYYSIYIYLYAMHIRRALAHHTVCAWMWMCARTRAIYSCEGMPRLTAGRSANDQRVSVPPVPSIRPYTQMHAYTPSSINSMARKLNAMCAQ